MRSFPARSAKFNSMTGVGAPVRARARARRGGQQLDSAVTPLLKVAEFSPHEERGWWMRPAASAASRRRTWSARRTGTTTHRSARIATRRTACDDEVCSLTGSAAPTPRCASSTTSASSRAPLGGAQVAVPCRPTRGTSGATRATRPPSRSGFRRSSPAAATRCSSAGWTAGRAGLEVLRAWAPPTPSSSCSSSPRSSLDTEARPGAAAAARARD